MKDKRGLDPLLAGFYAKQILLLLVVLLAGYFWYLFWQQQGMISQTHLALKANEFAEANAQIHWQWLQADKPQQLNWRNQTIILSQSGWPESVADSKNGLNCASLWQGLLDTDMLINNKPLQMRILEGGRSKGRGCLFYLDNQSGFEYWPSSGLINSGGTQLE